MGSPLPLRDIHSSWVKWCYHANYVITFSLVLLLCDVLAIQEIPLSDMSLRAAGTPTTTSCNNRPAHDELIRYRTVRGCRNGESYEVDGRAECACEPFFYGSACQYVNITAAKRIVIGSVVIFQWMRPPRLRGYSFIYTPVDHYSLHNQQQTRSSSIRMKDSDLSVVVGNLEGGGIQYRVCIDDDLPKQDIVRSEDVQQEANCVLVETQPDYDSLIGWGLVASLAAVVVLLMYSQKDKIELLYFSRPMTSFYAYDLETGEQPAAEEAKDSKEADQLKEIIVGRNDGGTGGYHTADHSPIIE